MVFNDNKDKSKHKTLSVVGKCRQCKNPVFDNELYVEQVDSVYHFSCHNRKVQKENECVDD